MKLIIAGSRDIDLTHDPIYNGKHKEGQQFSQFQFIVEYLLGKKFKQIKEVVSGHSGRVDYMGESFAHINNLELTKFPANWEKYGRAAGPIRNKQMAEYADAAIVIMKKGGSAGSKSMINEMKKLNKPVYVYEVD